MIRARAEPLCHAFKKRSLFMLVSPSHSTSAGDVHTSNRETRSRFSSDPCEFFRVGNDANRLNTPLLHINGQDGEDLTASADDQGGLTVDFR